MTEAEQRMVERLRKELEDCRHSVALTNNIITNLRSELDQAKENNNKLKEFIKDKGLVIPS